MSYILDALKKSERQRPPGPVPDLFTVQGPLPPSRQRPRWLGAAAGVAVVAALIGAWAWLGADRRQDLLEVRSRIDGGVSSRPAPGQLASPPAIRPAAAPAPSGEAAPSEPPRSRTLERATGARAPEMPAARPSARQPAPAGQAALVAPAVPAAPAAPASAAPEAPPPSGIAPAAAPPPATTLPDAPAAAAPPLPAAELPATGPAAAPATRPAPPTTAEPVPAPAPPVAEDLPPADGRVLESSDLPASIRAQLPPLGITGHVWSDEPALRLLTVGDRILREGAEAAPGVRLLEITAEGAVFDFRGWRYRVGGFRP